MSVRRRLDSWRGGFDFEWPVVAICAILLGFMMALDAGSSNAIVDAVNQLQRQLTWRPAEREARQALVITKNGPDQLTMVATLSPRGFAPLLAENKREVLSQIKSHPGTLRLALVDANLPDYALITHALKANLPLGSIIVLNGPHRSQDIGPMLLARLRIFETLEPTATQGLARVSGGDR